MLKIFLSSFVDLKHPLMECDSLVMLTHENIYLVLGNGIFEGKMKVALLGTVESFMKKGTYCETLTLCSR